MTLSTQTARAEPEVSSTSLHCHPPSPNWKELTWAGTNLDLSFWQWMWNYEVVGCYAPVYASKTQTWSPTTYYSPGPAIGMPAPTDPPGSTDGEEVTYVPRFGPDGGTLQGVYVWFEVGYWMPSPSGQWYWWCELQLCDPCWVANPGGSCFAAGTPVRTATGFKSIEELQVGDEILSAQRDQPDELPVARRVKQVIKSQAELLVLHINGREVRTTPSHPFYVKDKGWVAASSLKVGDLLRSDASGVWVKVDSSEEGSEAEVYSVVLDGQSGYFVGANDWQFSVWVSDYCGEGRDADYLVVQNPRPVKNQFLRLNTDLRLAP